MISFLVLLRAPVACCHTIYEVTKEAIEENKSPVDIEDRDEPLKQKEDGSAGTETGSSTIQNTVNAAVLPRDGETQTFPRDGKTHEPFKGHPSP